MASVMYYAYNNQWDVLKEHRPQQELMGGFVLGLILAVVVEASVFITQLMV